MCRTTYYFTANAHQRLRSFAWTASHYTTVIVSNHKHFLIHLSDIQTFKWSYNLSAGWNSGGKSSHFLLGNITLWRVGHHSTFQPSYIQYGCPHISLSLSVNWLSLGSMLYFSLSKMMELLFNNGCLRHMVWAGCVLLSCLWVVTRLHSKFCLWDNLKAQMTFSVHTCCYQLW